MSGSECATILNTALKTEPADSIDKEDCHDLSSSRKRKHKSLRRLYKNKGVISWTECKHETKQDKSDKDCDNCSVVNDRVNRINKSIVSSRSCNGLVDKFPVVTEVKRSDSHEETDSHCSDVPYSAHGTIFEADQKPSQEELAVYCRVSSKLNLAQSMCGRENVSPLTHDSTHDDDPVHVSIQDCNKGSHCQSVPTSGVKPCPISHALVVNTPLGEKATQLSSKKQVIHYKKKLIDSEIMKPIVNKDGFISFYQCRICKKGFNKRLTLRQHFISHTDRFACTSCTTRCKSKGDLIRHIQTHTKEKPFHCNICNTNYSRESILKKHTQTKLHIRACYEKRDHAHISRETNVDPLVTTQAKLKLGFTCNLCPKVTFSKSEYKKHARSHAVKYLCNICQKGCKSRLLLKIHKRSHNNLTNLICRFCSRSFANIYCLKEHAKSHRSDNSSKVAEEDLKKAGVCRNESANSSAEVSFLPQQGSKPASNMVDEDRLSVVRGLECDECHKIFSSKRLLAKHSSVHDEIYVCGVCAETFPNFSKLKVHLKLHEAIIKCDICNVTFCENKELEDHVQELHEQGNNYTCRFCYYHFDKASDLDSHMNNHTATKLFSGSSLNESIVPSGNQTRINDCVSVRALIKDTKTETSTVSYDQCDGTSDLENHKYSQAPSMRFSGASLDERAQHVGKTTERNCLISVNDVIKCEETKALSDNEKVNVTKITKKIKPCRFSDSDNGIILSHQEFNGIPNNAADVNDDNLNDSGSYDCDEELPPEINTVLENETLISEKSFKNGNKVPVRHREPLVYRHLEIMKKHCAEFERYSEIDPSSQFFRCKICDIIFHEDTYLKNHLKHHVCEFCNTFFMNKVKLSAHKSQHMTQLKKQIKTEANRQRIPKQSWKCALMVSSKSKKDLQEQMLNETEDVLEDKSSEIGFAPHFKCKLSHAAILSANKHLFDRYSSLDPMNDSFICTICKRNYGRSNTLTRHFKTHVCQFCNKFFKDKSDLREHKYNHIKKVEAAKVDNKIPSSSIVSKPNRDLFKKYFSLIDADKNIYMCILCNKEFVRRTVLTRHLKTHICCYCDKFFEDKYDLPQHIVAVHQIKKHYTDSDRNEVHSDMSLENDDKPCLVSSVIEKLDDKANKITLPPLPHGSSFQVHPSCSSSKEKVMFIQTPSSNNTSEKVDSKMVSIPGIVPSFLKIISQPVKVYQNISHKSFSNSSANYNCQKSEHLVALQLLPNYLSFLTKERDRPFQCGVCEKRFLKNDHLRSHMTIHTGYRPFICTLCSKAFGRSTVLQKHMKTHVKVCKICNASFNYKYELDFHTEIHKSYMNLK